MTSAPTQVGKLEANGNLTPITKDFEKSSIVLQKCGGRGCVRCSSTSYFLTGHHGRYCILRACEIMVRLFPEKPYDNFSKSKAFFARVPALQNIKQYLNSRKKLETEC